MARPASGQVIVDQRRRSPTFALRFRANGKREYLTLGSAADGWTREKAQLELENILADVRRGLWKAPAADPVPEPAADPTFHEFATDWFEQTKAEWSPNTRADYEWQLTRHLLPFFAGHRLSQITIAEVDRYRTTKLTEAEQVRLAARNGSPLTYTYRDRAGRTRRRARRPLSATSINKTITRLSQILELAAEYRLIEANPAKGRRRKVKTRRRTVAWIDNDRHIQALLDAAHALDRQALKTGGRKQTGGRAYRRPLLATLLFAGLRIGELTALRWRDIDLASNRIIIRRSKADDGLAEIDLLPALHDELATYKANAIRTGPDELVFASEGNTTMSDGNIRTRVLAPAITKANEALAATGEIPLPDGLTPHKLRHTFASLLIAAGVDAGTVMDQLRHADPSFTLRVYRHAMRRDPDTRRRLAQLVHGTDWQPAPATGALTPPAAHTPETRTAR